jgi:hypothetical protein
MLVRMLRPLRWAPDGINARYLDAGMEVDVPDALAASWIEAGVSEGVVVDEGPGEPAEEAPGELADVTAIKMAPAGKKVMRAPRGYKKRAPR